MRLQRGRIGSSQPRLRVARPSWKQVSRSGGLWARTLDHAGHTCDRVPCAIDLDLCQNVKWCHTGCIYGAKNTVVTNYLGAAEDAGVKVRPAREVQSVRRSSADGYRYIVDVSVLDWEGENPSRQPTGQTEEIECKVLILAAGAMGGIGEGELDRHVQTADKGVVHVLAQVGRQDDDTIVLLNALQEIANLDIGVAIVGVLHLRALTEQRVRFVKEQDAIAALRGIEDPLQVLLRLADVLADDPRQIDAIELAPERLRDYFSGHGLAGTRAAGEQRGGAAPA